MGKIHTDFSSGGVVLDSRHGKVLMVKVETLAKSVVWTFPKGHPESNETDTEAALREVLEETGWTCRIVKPLIDVNYTFTHDGVKTHKTVRWFLMEPIQKTGVFNPEEIMDCEWVNTQEVRNRITYDTDLKLMGHLGL